MATHHSLAQKTYGEIGTQIERGEYAPAIARLEELVKLGNRHYGVHRLLGLAYHCLGEDGKAHREIARARELKPDCARDEIEFGRALNGKGFQNAALECFRFAYELQPDDPFATSLVAMTNERLGNKDAAREFGQRTLELLDEQASAQKVELVDATRPGSFDPGARHRNIIAYSLFGNETYYNNAAITVARMAPAVYPEWTCRFYCGPETPERVLRGLNDFGAQTLVAPHPPQEWMGLFWRFWAFDDPNVDVVLVRDIDSPFTLRERLAVDEWLESDFPFHVIRDHIWHMEPMMAGLWGGFTGLLPPLKPLTEAYFPQADDNRYKDQAFLRLNVWPRIRHATLTHDRNYRLRETRTPPAHATLELNHIGFSIPKKGRLNNYERFIGLPQ